MLAIEGALLALTGALIGVVVGIGYGWIGAVTLLGDDWNGQFAVPAGRLALYVAIAIACGIVASMIPARRAANADPIAALAPV